MLSNFFRGRHDPFDVMSSQLDDIFGRFEEESLWQPPRGFYDDFEDDLWSYDPFINRRRNRGYRGLGGLGDEMRYLASSMSRQMQEIQRTFDNIEARLGNPALDDLSLNKEGSKTLESDAKKESSDKLNNDHSTNTLTNIEPQYKIVKHEKHYIGGPEPSKRSYFVKTEVNDNGHVKVKTAEKKPGEDWHVDVKEYDQPLKHALKSDEEQKPQEQIKNEQPQTEVIKADSGQQQQLTEEQPSRRPLTADRKIEGSNEAVGHPSC